MFVKFPSEDDTANAVRVWERFREFFIIDHDCVEPGMTTFHSVSQISSYSLRRKNIAIIIERVEPQDVFDKFDLVINENQIRDDGRGLVEGGYRWFTGFNADPITNQALLPRLKVPGTSSQSGIGQWSCLNCYLSAELSVSLKFEFEYFKLKRAKLGLMGKFAGNATAEFFKGGVSNLANLQATLGSLPLTPFSVPGLFKVGPELDLATALSLDAVGEISLTFGFEFEVPFRFDLNIVGEEEEEIEHKPATFKFHKFTPSFVGKVKASLHMIPQFYLGLNIFSTDIFAGKVIWDSSVGAELVAGSRPVCSANSKFGLNLYHQNKISTILALAPTVESHTLYDSKEVPFNCQFCQVCF